MNLINEEKKVCQWASEKFNLEKEYIFFSKCNESVESYYEDYDESWHNLIEYNVDSFEDAKKMFDKLWRKKDFMQEMILISAVSMMKCKPRENITETNLFSSDVNNENDLPDYVYVF